MINCCCCHHGGGGGGGGGALNMENLISNKFVNSVRNKEIYMFIVHVSKWLTDFWTALHTQL